MTTLKCAVCSGTNLFGPTHACAEKHDHEVMLVCTDVPTQEKRYIPLSGTLCLECGHVALFVSPARLLRVREKAGHVLQPIVDND